MEKQRLLTRVAEVENIPSGEPNNVDPLEVEAEIEPKVDNKKRILKIFKFILTNVKNFSILFIFLGFCIAFALHEEPHPPHYYSITKDSNISFVFPVEEQTARLQILLKCPITQQIHALSVKDISRNLKLFLHLDVQRDDNFWEPFANQTLSLFKTNETALEDYIETSYIFSYPELKNTTKLQFSTTSEFPIPIQISILHQSVLIDYQVLMAFIIFVGVYSLIIFDLISRPLAGLVGVFVCEISLNV
jgi:hypothetical protein